MPANQCQPTSITRSCASIVPHQGFPPLGGAGRGDADDLAPPVRVTQHERGRRARRLPRSSASGRGRAGCGQHGGISVLTESRPCPRATLQMTFQASRRRGGANSGVLRASGDTPPWRDAPRATWVCALDRCVGIRRHDSLEVVSRPDRRPLGRIGRAQLRSGQTEGGHMTATVADGAKCRGPSTCADGIHWPRTGLPSAWSGVPATSRSGSSTARGPLCRRGADRGLRADQPGRCGSGDRRASLRGAAPADWSAPAPPGRGRPSVGHPRVQGRLPGPAA